jgi:NAD-dependent dihydropyrimidine dehydrogenase PreA subunit
MNILLIIISIIILLLFLSPFKKRNNTRRKIAHIDLGRCIGCQQCLISCRHGALSIIIDKSGKHAVRNADKCTGCGDCVSICPHQAIKLVEREDIKSQN